MIKRTYVNENVATRHNLFSVCSIRGKKSEHERNCLRSLTWCPQDHAYLEREGIVKT